MARRTTKPVGEVIGAERAQPGIPPGRKRVGMVTCKFRIDMLDDNGDTEREVWTNEYPLARVQVKRHLRGLLKDLGLESEES